MEQKSIDVVILCRQHPLLLVRIATYEYIHVVFSYDDELYIATKSV